MNIERTPVTIAEARDWLMRRRDKGARCPCCGRFVKVYPRKLNAGMIKSLIQMYRKGGRDWVHLPSTIDAHSREEGKMAYFGLVEEQKALRPDGGRAGYWRVTEKGERFLQGVITVPKYALVFLGTHQGFKGEQISVHDAIGDKFDYLELMTE